MTGGRFHDLLAVLTVVALVMLTTVNVVISRRANAAKRENIRLKQALVDCGCTKVSR